MASLLKRPDSKYWIASFTDSLGRQLKRSTKETDKSEAMKIALQFESAAAGKMSVKQAQTVIGDLLAAHGKSLPTITVREWVRRWTARREAEVSLATYRFYESTGRKWVEWLGARADGPLAGQTVHTLMEYRDSLAARLSTYSANHRMVAVSMMLRAARLERLIDENPMDFVKPLKESRSEADGPGRQPFTVPQIKAILQVSDPEWKSMVMHGAYTGQRLADVATLRWDKVDMAAGTVSLKTRKTGRWQSLPMAPALREHLGKWEAGRDGRNTQHASELHEYVHPRAAGHVVRTGVSGRLSNEFAQLLVYAGIRKGGATEPRAGGGKGREVRRTKHALSFHSLRHTATSWMKAAGIPASVVMDFIGHDDSTMSRIYTHTGDEALRKAADSLPSI